MAVVAERDAALYLKEKQHNVPVLVILVPSHSYLSSQASKPKRSLVPMLGFRANFLDPADFEAFRAHFRLHNLLCREIIIAWSLLWCHNQL